jgi:hypothetical protein
VLVIENYLLFAETMCPYACQIALKTQLEFLALLLEKSLSIIFAYLLLELPNVH